MRTAVALPEMKDCRTHTRSNLLQAAVNFRTAFTVLSSTAYSAMAYKSDDVPATSIRRRFQRALVRCAFSDRREGCCHGPSGAR